MKRLALCAALAFLTSCGPDNFQGEVVGKYHRSAYTTIVWIPHGPRGGGHMAPIYHPERWCLIVANGGTERMFDVSESVYNDPPLGQQWPPNRTEVAEVKR